MKAITTEIGVVLSGSKNVFASHIGPWYSNARLSINIFTSMPSLQTGYPQDERYFRAQNEYRFPCSRIISHARPVYHSAINKNL